MSALPLLKNIKNGLFIIYFANSIFAYAGNALTVEVVTPRQQEISEQVSGSGFLVAKQPALINAQINGVSLVQLNVDVGDVVKKGQILARFDDTPVRLEVAQAKAQVDMAENAFQLAEQDAQRAQTLLAADAISRSDGERMIASRADAKSRLSAARAQLATQQWRLNHTVVRAPDNGVITAKQAVLGAIAGVGQPLFELMIDGQLAWQAKVPVTSLDKIKQGTVVKLPMANGHTVLGKVYQIASTVQAQSREALVLAKMANSPELHAGMLVRGVFELGKSQALTIPAVTVMRDDGIAYTWVVTNHQVKRKNIVLGRRLGDRVVVLSGLNQSDRIVLRGGGFLSDGDVVKIVNPAKDMK